MSAYDWLDELTYLDQINGRYAEKENPLIKSTVVFICGNIKHKEAFATAFEEEKLKGKIVFNVGLFGVIPNTPLDAEVAEILDSLNYEKVDISDEILVLNVDGKIDESTQYLIDYANSKNKSIRYLIS